MDKGIIVHCAIIKENKLLILKRIESTYLGGYWDLPGGTLEDGEDPAAGVLRETQEETGLNIYDISLFFHYSNLDKKKNKQFITLVFLAKTESDSSNIKINPKEHSDFRWSRLEGIKDRKLVPWLVKCLESDKISFSKR